ncbi:MAG TPA: hypothetical protein VIE65_19895 [Methylobacter sp.]|jgi:hypothetical protein
MSYDYALERICSHEVAFESISLDTTDMRSARFGMPPSNSRIRVFLDRVEIPQGGFFSYAEIPFASPEPYRIKSGVNDLIYLSTNFGIPKFIQLVPGGAVKASDLAQDLQRKIPELIFLVSRGRVVVRNREAIKGTVFQFLDPRWTDKTESIPTTSRVLNCYKSVGIIPGRAVGGRRLFPGWSIGPDPSSPDGFDKLLIFDDRLQNHDPLIEVCYVTNQQNCRRCHGTQVEFDYGVINGTYETIMDLDLLAQEFDKFVYTKIGSHWKWNWLGSGLVDRIGGKGSTGTVTVNSMITFDISQAFKTYQNLKQKQDANFPQQQVSDAEFPQQLANIDVRTLPDDPTVAIVTSTIVSRSRVPVPLKRIIGNPNPFTLAGDPVQNIRLQGGQAQFRFRA